MPGKSLFVPVLNKTIVFCLLLSPFVRASDDSHYDDSQYKDSRTDVREFVARGRVHVRMGVGDLRITRGDSTEIRLRYTVKSRRERNVKEATVDFAVHGADANLEFHAPMGGSTNFDVELEVPENTNLDVHEKVGDMTVEQVEGDKDLDLNVGDIRVTADRSKYSLVRASTSIGDVHGGDYGTTDGWLGKSLKYHGSGKYELRAHVSVGDISLEGK
ncbi:MAG TPA: hypothetical protein VI386_06565 [Candidatus Sulfotelmatobacter sp.]